MTAGQRTPSGALMAKALTDGADEAKSGGMGMGRASRTPRGSPGAIWTELWAPQGGYAAAAAKPVWIPLQCSRVYYAALYPIWPQASRPISPARGLLQVENPVSKFGRT